MKSGVNALAALVLMLAAVACSERQAVEPVDARPGLRAALPSPASLGTGWETVEEDEFEPSVESGDYADTLPCAAVQLATQAAWDGAGGDANE